MIGRLLALVWQLGAVAFLASVVWTVRRARARGKRLFRDEPLKRLRGLHADARQDHRWDAM